MPHKKSDLRDQFHTNLPIQSQYQYFHKNFLGVHYLSKQWSSPLPNINIKNYLSGKAAAFDTSVASLSSGKSIWAATKKIKLNVSL